jgi:hypothetical protein
MRGRKRKLRKLTSENHQFRNLIATGRAAANLIRREREHGMPEVLG